MQRCAPIRRRVERGARVARMLFHRAEAYKIALRAEKRMSSDELRQRIDTFTGERLDDWQLTRMAEWVEDHPAYQALPERADAPTGDNDKG